MQFPHVCVRERERKRETERDRERNKLECEALNPRPQTLHSFNDWELGNSRADLSPPYDKEKWHNLERQPVDDFLMGKWSCTNGADCHDRTHQAGLIDGGNQYYDNYPMGSIDRNSPQSIHAEY
jgi:hypothetical protein